MTDTEARTRLAEISRCEVHHDNFDSKAAAWALRRIAALEEALKHMMDTQFDGQCPACRRAAELLRERDDLS